MPYLIGQPPGTYEHRGRWCNWCGDNVSFYRAYKKPGPFRCAACDRQEGESADSPSLPPPAPDTSEGS